MFFNNMRSVTLLAALLVAACAAEGPGTIPTISRLDPHTPHPVLSREELAANCKLTIDPALAEQYARIGEFSGGIRFLPMELRVDQMPWLNPDTDDFRTAGIGMHFSKIGGALAAQQASVGGVNAYYSFQSGIPSNHQPQAWVEHLGETENHELCFSIISTIRGQREDHAYYLVKLDPNTNKLAGWVRTTWGIYGKLEMNPSPTFVAAAGNQSGNP